MLKNIKILKVKECLSNSLSLEKTKGMLIMDQQKDFSVIE